MAFRTLGPITSRSPTTGGTAPSTEEVVAQVQVVQLLYKLAMIVEY